MIDNKSIQASLWEAGFYKGPIDGQVGTQVHAAIKNVLDNIVPQSVGWTDARRFIAYQQYMMGQLKLPAGLIDGFVGPQTLYALEKWQDHLRGLPGPALAGPANIWPQQSECKRYYGAVGTNQVRLIPPYQMYLYDTNQKVNSISVHKKVHNSTLRVLQKVLQHYGPEEIHRLHLDRFFGSLNVRKMRGGSGWSMHAWGIAIDIDANRNQLRWGWNRAAFGQPIYKKWFEAWESEGAVSLGRERNYDFMHTQFARL